MSKKPTRVIPPPPAEGVEVFGLGDGATLTFILERRRRQDLAAAEGWFSLAWWRGSQRGLSTCRSQCRQS